MSFFLFSVSCTSSTPFPSADQSPASSDNAPPNNLPEPAAAWKESVPEPAASRQAGSDTVWQQPLLIKTETLETAEILVKPEDEPEQDAGISLVSREDLSITPPMSFETVEVENLLPLSLPSEENAEAEEELAARDSETVPVQENETEDPLNSEEYDSEVPGTEEAVTAMVEAEEGRELTLEEVAEEIETETSLPEDSPFPVVEEPESPEATYDLPVVRNARVERLMHFYLYRKRDILELGFARSTRYVPMFQRVLKEHGLPQDLAYLVAIESNYNSRAHSHRAAAGLWQFIPSTGHLYGLRSNRWIDERLDPVKATHAAAKYLKKLYHQFGHWELALAAYNTGEGRVERAIRKARAQGKPTDFWSLQLPRETRNYVPALMAVMIVSKNLDKYGLSPAPEQEPFPETKITLPTYFPLQEIAQRANLPFEELLDLNPSLYRGLPPLYEEKYELTLPSVYHAPLLASLEENPEPSTKWTAAYAKLLDRTPGMTRLLSEHGQKIYARVRRGDNLWELARRYETTVSRLKTWNQLEDKSLLRVGRRLKIYLPNWQVYTQAARQQSVSIRRAIPLQHARTIRVPEGSTLSGLAAKYGTSVHQLMRWNQLSSPLALRANQTLIVGQANPPLIVGRAAGLKSGEHRVIIVRRGDTLWSIAQTYGTSVQQLLALNGLESSEPLKLNQKILVPQSNDS